MEQFALVPFQLGRHVPRPTSTLCLIQKPGIPVHRRVGGTPRRAGQQWLDVPQQRIISRQADGILETLGF
jgi:hypothetical protein